MALCLAAYNLVTKATAVLKAKQYVALSSEEYLYRTPDMTPSISTFSKVVMLVIFVASMTFLSSICRYSREFHYHVNIPGSVDIMCFLYLAK